MPNCIRCWSEYARRTARAVHRFASGAGAGREGDRSRVTIERAGGAKCERCWKYTTDIGSDPQFPTICAPCAAAVKEILNG